VWRVSLVGMFRMSTHRVLQFPCLCSSVAPCVQTVWPDGPPLVVVPLRGYDCCLGCDLVAVHFAHVLVVVVSCGPLLLWAPAWLVSRRLYSSDRAPGPVGCSGLQGACMVSTAACLGCAVHMLACLQSIHDAAPDGEVALQLL
jgi:hypothetical protein